MADMRNGWLVEVYLYDLSHGMAGQMSEGIIGKRLECIPHTGCVVYGYEYFFGGGIQSSAPGMTVAGRPWRRYTVGFTDKSQETFHQWCMENAARFSPANYDLLTHNCNNFSEEACVFLTGKSIPKFITELPEEALSSPMGAMLRPMIDNMMSQVQNAGVIPGMNNPVVRPNLPMCSSSSAPAISSTDRQRVEAYDAEETERNARRARERAQQPQQSAFNNNPQANPFAAFMQNMQPPAQQQFQPPAPQAQPAPTPVVSSSSSSKFKIFNPDPKPVLTIDKVKEKALAQYEKRLHKQIANADAKALTTDIIRICKGDNERLQNRHFIFMSKLCQQVSPNKLLTILSTFRYMTVRPEAVAFFETQLTKNEEFIISILSHVGLVGDGKKANDYILVLVNVCFAHLYNNNFPIQEVLVDAAMACIDGYSNTVSLSASRLLFNMVIQMEKILDDHQCVIASALLEKLPTIKHIGTRRQCIKVICWLLHHIEDVRDLATTMDFDASALKTMEGNEQKDNELLDDLVAIMSETGV